MALAAFLGLAWRQEMPEAAEETQLGEWMAERYQFESYQRVIEAGLVTALKKAGNEEDE